MPSGIRNILLIASVAVLVVIVLFFRPRQDEAEKESQHDAVTGNAAENRARDESEFDQKLDEAQQQGRRPHGLLPLSENERAAGLTKRETSLAGQRVILNFVLKPKGRCMFGDIDLIKQDLSHSKDAKLLLTVEPLLAPEAEPAARAVLSSEQLVTGTSKKIAVSLKDATRHYGLFICTASEENGSCSDKPLMDFGRQIQQYSDLDKRNAELPRDADDQVKAALEKEYAELSQDKLYYFSYLGISEAALSTLSPQMEEPNYRALELELHAAASAPRTLLASIKRYHEGTSSVALDVSTDRLQLVLPKLDLSACGDETEAE